MKKFLFRLLSWFNLGEGIIHFLVAMISLWGIAETKAWDLRVLAAPITDLILGIVSLVTGIVLGKWNHHH
jgi:hypothetical protein